jgi:hypothetical protein
MLTMQMTPELNQILDACQAAVELEGTPGECPRFELFYLVRGIANLIKQQTKTPL